MNKLKIAVVVVALLLPTVAQAQRGGAQSTFGRMLPKIKVDPNQKGWTPLWMREDSQEFEK